ncbi:MAG: diguanylate cyclase [Desulfobacteraceae bacterium]|nr:diguanylate cyclase [Desulfobacteraceae bacterium]MBC2754123.1 diguanylate cyclase [Desulfobacteraceae bacterium]
MKKDFGVMLVEDSRTQALKFQLMLESHGYHVTVAQNGLEAMNMLLNSQTSIVISDWIMPEMDGSELCRAIRKHDFGNYLYIILLTAKDSKNDIIEGLEAGADDYLTKPVDDAELIARLTTAERVIRLESSLKQRNNEIALLSITDPLTKIFNRGYLNDNLPKAFKRAIRYNQKLSIIICDIDHFKTVNDNYGHQTGDIVLKSFVKELNSSLRKDLDWMARYGGEEFIIVLPETDLNGATAAAERFRSRISKLVTHAEGKDIQLTASFGIAAISHEGDKSYLTTDDLIQAADRCLYQAKDRGRNKCIGASI